MKTLYSFLAIVILWGIIAAAEFKSPVNNNDPSNIEELHNAPIDRNVFEKEMIQYVKDHPVPVNTASSCSYTQTILQQYQCVLTTYSISHIDSALSVIPTFATGYLDASLYNKPFDSLRVTIDSVLVAVVLNESSGSGTDSVLIIRLGGFSNQDKGAIIDTLATKNVTLIERWLRPSGLTAKLPYIYPYWGFEGVGVACTDVNATIYIFNILRNTSVKGN